MAEETLRKVRALLREALVSGTPDPPWRDRPWPAPLRWTRRIGIGRIPYYHVTVFTDFLLAWIILGISVGNITAAMRDSGLWPLLLSLAVAVPVALRSLYPVGSWRVSGLALLVLTLQIAPGYDPQPWPMSASVAYLLCLYSVAVRCQRDLTLTIAAISIVCVPVLTRGGVIIVSVILVLATMAFGYNVRQRRLAQEEVVEQAKIHQQAQAVLQERQRIARELHDVVAHHMSVIAIQAEAAPYKVAEPQPELTESLADIRKLALEGLNELRRILGVLRTETGGAETAPQPGLDRVEELIASAEAGGLTVRSAVTGEPRALPRATELSAYRIVQEALSNVMRHAPGAHVEVVTGYEPDQLRLVILNDPVDTPPDLALDHAGSGHGLVGMRERAGMLGGTLTAEPTPQGGFVVTATLPARADS